MTESFLALAMIKIQLSDRMGMPEVLRSLVNRCAEGFRAFQILWSHAAENTASCRDSGRCVGSPTCRHRDLSDDAKSQRPTAHRRPGSNRMLRLTHSHDECAEQGRVPAR